MIFDWLKKKVKKEKPVMLCIHGFGSRRGDEYNNLIRFFHDKYEIVVPELFDQSDENDDNPELWVTRAENYLKENLDKKVYLVGFSMGGVIASYLASKYNNIVCLVLLEPAFEFISFTTAKETALKALGKRRSNENYIPLPTKWTQSFARLVNTYKKYIEDVTCPTLFIHCVDDELIHFSSSVSGYRRMKSNNKRLFIIGDGQHRVMDDERNSNFVFKMMRRFFRNPMLFLDVKDSNAPAD